MTILQLDQAQNEIWKLTVYKFDTIVAYVLDDPLPKTKNSLLQLTTFTGTIYNLRPNAGIGSLAPNVLHSSSNVYVHS